MKQIFFLSGEHVDLAREEVLALTNSTKYHGYDRILIAENNMQQLEKRLAYTHMIYDFLFESTPKNIKKDIQAYDWQKIYSRNFCANIINFSASQKFNEKELGSLIWHKLKNPKVKLKDSKTEIAFFIFDKKIFCGRFRAAVTKDFNARRPHLRPKLHPTSLHPKLARACVNLTGVVDRKARIADLMCGSGGILIEMGLMGFRPFGMDNDKSVLWKAKMNLDFYGIKDYDAKLGDATKARQKFDHVVVDLPYGKNTKKAGKSELERFYLAFLLNLRKILQGKAVVIFPDFSRYKALLKKSGFKLEKEFTIYIHGSLSRKICVIS